MPMVSTAEKFFERLAPGEAVPALRFRPLVGVVGVGEVEAGGAEGAAGGAERVAGGARGVGRLRARVSAPEEPRGPAISQVRAHAFAQQQGVVRAG